MQNVIPESRMNNEVMWFSVIGWEEEWNFFLKWYREAGYIQGGGHLGDV